MFLLVDHGGTIRILLQLELVIVVVVILIRVRALSYWQALQVQINIFTNIR